MKKTIIRKILFGFLFLGSSHFVPVLYSQTGAASDFYPLEVGNYWNYTNGFFPQTERIIDTTRINGLLYYGLAMGSGDIPEYWLRTEDETVYLYHEKDSTEYILFIFNADIDISWQLPAEYGCSFGTEITVAGVHDTIITPSGVYTNTFHFRHFPQCADAGTFDTWFAKDVGKVRFIADNIAGAMDNKLVDYSVLATKVSQELSGIPNSYHLYPNYPNPFNPSTTIQYELPISSHVSLTIYDVKGCHVKTLVDEIRQAGLYEITWNGTNEFEDQVAGGIYLCRMKTEQFVHVLKMILVR